MHFSVFLPIPFVKALSVFFFYKDNTVVLSVRTSDAQEKQSSCRRQEIAPLVMKTPPLMKSEGAFLY